MKLNTFLFLILYYTININCTIVSEQLNASSNQNNYWRNLANIFNRFVGEQSKLIYHNWETVKDNHDIQKNVSKQCLNVIEHIIKNPIGEEWSAKCKYYTIFECFLYIIHLLVIDSMVTLPTGVLSGSTTHLGDFDQCLEIEGNFHQQEFVGKYCLATIHLPKNESINLKGNDINPPWLFKAFQQWKNNNNWFSFASGICFPSICKPEEIKTIISTCK